MCLKAYDDRRPFFAYVKSDAHLAERLGPPETVQHLLFKEALATLQTVRLVWQGESHVIRIQKAAIEPTLNAGSSVVKPDVAWRFTSDTLLDKNWGSKVYVEVCHKHPVPDTKLKALKAADLPFIEVEIPPDLLFRGDESSSEDWQRNYIAHVKKHFEERARPLTVIPISNPTSPAVDALLSELASHRLAADKAETELAETQSRFAEAQLEFHHTASNLRSLIPATPSASLPKPTPRFVLTRSDDPVLSPSIAPLQDTRLKQTAPHHQGVLAAAWMILGGLVAFSIVVIRDRWLAPSDPVPIAMVGSKVVAPDSQPDKGSESDPRHSSVLPHANAHAKRKQKKKVTVKAPNGTMLPTAPDGTADPEPSQWFQVAPQAPTENPTDEALEQ